MLLWEKDVFGLAAGMRCLFYGLLEELFYPMAIWPLASTVKTHSYMPTTSRGFYVYYPASKKVQLLADGLGLDS